MDRVNPPFKRLAAADRKVPHHPPWRRRRHLRTALPWWQSRPPSDARALPRAVVVAAGARARLIHLVAGGLLGCRSASTRPDGIRRRPWLGAAHSCGSAVPPPRFAAAPAGLTAAPDGDPPPVRDPPVPLLAGSASPWRDPPPLLAGSRRPLRDPPAPLLARSPALPAGSRCPWRAPLAQAPRPPWLDQARPSHSTGQYLNHPNSRIGAGLMPIPDSGPQYQHPNAV